MVVDCSRLFRPEVRLTVTADCSRLFLPEVFVLSVDRSLWSVGCGVTVVKRIACVIWTGSFFFLSVLLSFLSSFFFEQKEEEAGVGGGGGRGRGEKRGCISSRFAFFVPFFVSCV